MVSSDADYNPGNNDPDVGDAIAEGLGRADTTVPTGSPAAIELERRHTYLSQGVSRMEYYDEADKWWDGPKKGDATVA